MYSWIGTSLPIIAPRVERHVLSCFRDQAHTEQFGVMTTSRYHSLYLANHKWTFVKMLLPKYLTGTCCWDPFSGAGPFLHVVRSNDQEPIAWQTRKVIPSQKISVLTQHHLLNFAKPAAMAFWHSGVVRMSSVLVYQWTSSLGVLQAAGGLTIG